MINKDQLLNEVCKTKCKIAIIEANYKKINLTINSIFNLITTFDKLYSIVLESKDDSKLNEYIEVFNSMNAKVNTFINQINKKEIDKPIYMYKLPFIINKLYSDKVYHNTIYFKLLSLGIITINFIRDLYDNNILMGIIKDENEYKRLLSLFNNYLFTNYDTMNYNKDIEKYNNTISIVKDNVIDLYDKYNIDNIDEVINVLDKPNPQTLYVYFYAILMVLDCDKNIDNSDIIMNNMFINDMTTINDKLNTMILK